MDSAVLGTDSYDNKRTEVYFSLHFMNRDHRFYDALPPDAREYGNGYYAGVASRDVTIRCRQAFGQALSYANPCPADVGGYLLSRGSSASRNPSPK